MARSLTARDRAALVALASALIALVWPLLESTGSGCPLGYGANETVARSFHDVPGTSPRVQNATVFARCAPSRVGQGHGGRRRRAEAASPIDADISLGAVRIGVALHL